MTDKMNSMREELVKYTMTVEELQLENTKHKTECAQLTRENQELQNKVKELQEEEKKQVSTQRLDFLLYDASTAYTFAKLSYLEFSCSPLSYLQGNAYENGGCK